MRLITYDTINRISEDSRKVFTDELATAFILDNKPSLEKPWNRRWAVMLRPPLKFSSDAENLNHEGEGISGNPKPQMIGIIGIPRPSEIGYKMHPDFWGKGYMTEALGLAINIFWESEGQCAPPRTS
jgi:[ribosomal protein S5]-alanine N-acetyltransferase